MLNCYIITFTLSLILVFLPTHNLKNVNLTALMEKKYRHDAGSFYLFKFLLIQFLKNRPIP